METSLKMILGYFEPEIDYTIEETEKITGKVPEKGSWSFDWSIWFVNHGYFVKHYTVFDFESFKKDGIDYIRQKYGNETADWQLANSDIEHAKSLVDEYLSKVVIVDKQPTINDIKVELDNGFVAKAMVNSNVLNDEEGYEGQAEITAPDNHLHSYALFKDTSRPQDGMDYSPMPLKANAWVQDFTYLRIRSRMFYLALVMDLSTREILSWKLGTNHSSQLTHIALIQALGNNPSPSIVHSDRGSEYLSERHQDTCDRFEIQLSASSPGRPWQNGFMERCIKSIKEELGSLARYQTIDELYIGIANAISYYNNDRIHTALKMSPAAYAASLKPKLKLKSKAKPKLKRRGRVFGKKVA